MSLPFHFSGINGWDNQTRPWEISDIFSVVKIFSVVCPLELKQLLADSIIWYTENDLAAFSFLFLVFNGRFELFFKCERQEGEIFVLELLLEQSKFFEKCQHEFGEIVQRVHNQHISQFWKLFQWRMFISFIMALCNFVVVNIKYSQIQMCKVWHSKIKLVWEQLRISCPFCV